MIWRYLAIPTTRQRRCSWWRRWLGLRGWCEGRVMHDDAGVYWKCGRCGGIVR